MSKYKAIKTVINGTRFDSIAEKDFYLTLKEKETSGELKIVQLQPKVYMTLAKILIKPDFLILNCSTNELIYYEVKGFETSTYKIKKRLWKKYGPAKMVVFVKFGRMFKVKEEVVPDGNLEGIN